MSLRNIRRLYTTTGLTDWTRSSLHRLKKAQLLQIAQENQLKVAGTKSDIIKELLDYQKSKLTPSPPQELQGSNYKGYSQNVTSEKSDVAHDWVDAFDRKLAQRGSSFKRPFDSKRSPPTFRPHLEKKKVEIKEGIIPIEKIKEQVASQPELVQDIEPLEGMDGLWVEAFDRKVGTRGSRHQMPDTLSSKPKLSGLGLEFVAFESPDSPKTKEEKKIEIEPKVVESAPNKMTEKEIEKDDEISHHIDKVVKSEPLINKESKGQEKQSNVVSGVIGTSMLVWYFGGGDAFQKIWDFFGSSL